MRKKQTKKPKLLNTLDESNSLFKSFKLTWFVSYVRNLDLHKSLWSQESIR